MHVGRGYPQMKERLLSPDFTVPWFAPVRCEVGMFIDTVGGPTGPKVLITDAGTTDYSTGGFLWQKSFMWGIYPLTCRVFQAVNFIRPGVTMIVGVFLTPVIGAYVQQEFPSVGSDWLLGWSSIGAWSQHLNNPPFLHFQGSLLKGVQYY